MAGRKEGDRAAGGAGETPEDLQRRIEALTAAVAARDAFLAIAAHELRNPMTPIVGHVQRLRRQAERRTLTLEDVEQGLKRVEWLIDLYLKRATTLLDVSRIASGKLRLEIEDVDVSDLVRVIATGLEPAANYAGSNMQIEIENELTFATDRLALEQIVDNLLLNAIKYGAGKPIALVAARRGLDLCLEIRDCGIGISEVDQMRIFQPFERAIAYGNQAGFGVGLWVVRQLVDAMGGTIRIDSIPNVGTTFTVTVPQQTSSASA